MLTEARQMVLHGGLGVRGDGTWAAFELCNVQPRQNGKSSTLQALIMLALKDGEQVAYTCHCVDSSQEVFRSLVSLVEASPELAPLLKRVIYSNGKESIWLENGARGPAWLRDELEYMSERYDVRRQAYVASFGEKSVVPPVAPRPEHSRHLWHT